MPSSPTLPTSPSPDNDPAPAILTTLPNGVRVVVIRLPHVDSASVSVFVRTGSRHESRRLNGISHVVEHMAFKGTHERDARQINLDAEQLGAEVNAHTDKDHTAYHMRGQARHAGDFLRMLGDIVQHSSFPEAELERERRVILQEFLEDEEDPMSSAYKLFDQLCFGTHPMAQAVIGTRRNIEGFTRDDLLAYVQAQYSGANVVVGVAGNVDAQAVIEQAEAAFGAMPQGVENRVEAPAYLGGAKLKRQGDSSQSHIVLGFPIASTKADPQAAIVAAAVFGEGMSSPLMYELRERRGLVYYASCSADISDLCGQFVIEASTLPEDLDESLAEVARLLLDQAAQVDDLALQRARNQIAVRHLGTQERPYRLLEEAVQDVFTFGRVRSPAEQSALFDAVSAGKVQQVFRYMLAAGASIAVAGKAPKSANDSLARFVESTRR